ncbi:MAG: SPOR domain-containing protein [Acidobacteria bacterium]|nr:SPOR domain-containing protein [Acidobacteriota bacterium]
MPIREPERERPRGGTPARGKEKTVILNTRDLVLLFVFFIVVLMIVFTIGLMVGRNFIERTAEARPKDEPRTEQRVMETEPAGGPVSPGETGTPATPPAHSPTPPESTASASIPATPPPASATPPPASAKTPPPPTVKEPPKPEPRGGFYVQVKAVKTEAEARKEVAGLKDRYPGAAFVPSGNKAYPFRIIVGRANDSAGALLLRDRARKDFPGAIIGKPNP